MKILLLDDDNLDSFITQRLLSLEHEVVSFTGTDEALAWATANTFDIALIDYYLDRGQKGPDVLEKLLALRGATFKAFLLTNYVDSAEQERLRKTGFTDIIEKPFSLEKFKSFLP